MEVATEAYQSLVRQYVGDHRALWKLVVKRMSHDPDYVHYVELYGHEMARKLFRLHVKKLKEEFVERKRALYLQRLPHALRDVFPDSASGEDEGRHYGTKPGHFETSKIHFPTNKGVSEVSERANE